MVTKNFTTNCNQAKHMSDSNRPTHEQITRRAYEIFIERGRPEGCDLEHWLEAEKQLRAAGQGQTKNATPVSANTAPSTTPTPVRATQPAATSNGRSSGNGKPAAPRAAARK
jgi:hypothetical protein